MITKIGNSYLVHLSPSVRPLFGRQNAGNRSSIANPEVVPAFYFGPQLSSI